jgi:hypothetical protein
MDCLQEADLRVQKYIEIVKRLQAFQRIKPNSLLCMGSKRLASKKRSYKSRFRCGILDIPVVLNRVDGHAIIVK